MSHPLISVIVPVYNIREYLTPCIQSITSQSYSDLEIILVDDGSTDDSLVKCQEFASQDARIKIISQINGGVSVARNTGLEKATGDFLAFVDGDDVVAEDYFERLILGMQDETILSMCGHMRFADFPCQFPMERHASIVLNAGECARKLLAGTFPVCVCVGILRTREAKKLRFPVGVKNNEDKYFIFQYLMYHEDARVYYSNDQLYGYYVRPGSATTASWSGDTGMINVARQIYDLTMQRHPEWEDLAKRNLLNAQFTTLKSILRSGRVVQETYETLKTLRKEILFAGIPHHLGFRMKLEFSVLRMGLCWYRLLVWLFYSLVSLEARQRYNEKKVMQ